MEPTIKSERSENQCALDESSTQNVAIDPLADNVSRQLKSFFEDNLCPSCYLMTGDWNNNHSFYPCFFDYLG